jgi:hypothetical protein
MACTTASNGTSPRVLASLQARGYEGDPVRGHRGQGVLIAPDLVLVPALARDGTVEGDDYDVLFAPADAADPRAPERVPAAYTVAHATGDGELVAFVRLARPSSFPVVKPGARTAPGRADRAVGPAGVLAAVAGLAGLPADAVTAVLRRVAHVGAAEPLRGLQIVVHDNPDDAGGGICPWVPWCELAVGGDGPAVAHRG